MIVLALGLAGALTIFALTYLQLEEANKVIDEQKELIEKKQTFSAAMGELTDTVSQFDGVKFSALIPQNRNESLASRGWAHRWNGEALDRDTAHVRDATDELRALLSIAREQAATNASGTAFEAVIDQLGGGYVTSVIDDADTLCHLDVLGCVISDDPYVVHFDAADNREPFMTDFLRSGIAYHEFAHVLQMTNPEPSAIAAEAFGGDHERMADCFALTYLPGWMLDHTVWISDSQYVVLSVGYGYTCDEPQRQVIRSWYESLGYQSVPLEP